MGSPVVQLMLESMAAPFILAGLVLVSVRMLGFGRSLGTAEACALVLAIGTTYALAFGLPADLVFSARVKIMLSAFGGLVIGIAVDQRARWTGQSHLTGLIGIAGAVAIAGAVGIPIWIGLPALLQGRPESMLLALPIAAALAAPWLIDEAPAEARPPGILIALTLALGLAVIAMFAKAFSFAELGLSLGSALLAILAIGRRQFGAPAAFTAAAMLLALFTALLLYSEASLPALCMLGTVIGGQRLAGLTRSKLGRHATALPALVFCVLPAAAAILIARIDAGPFSLY